MERIFYIPKCVEPVVIVNENALRLISQGAKSPLPSVNMLNHADVSKASLIKHVLGDCKPSVELLSPYEVHLNDEEEYLFQLVPCGHCEHCQDKKQLDIVNRCRLESELYDCPAYFFTLTYAPKYLPYRGELKYSDVQRFWKRLRINWTRKGLEHDIRFLVSGEYGSKRQRPHYHVILWNNPYHCSEMQPWLHKRLAVDIFEAWSMCEWQSFDFGQCGDGAAAYAAKYAGKYQGDCKHWTKPFIKTSIGHGGIGYPYLKQYMDYYRNNPSLKKIVYVSKFDGVVKEINYGSYISQHIFPSPSRLVNPMKKALFKQLTDLLTIMVKMSMFTFEEAMQILKALQPADCVRIKLSRKECKHYIKHVCWFYELQYLKVYEYLVQELSVKDEFVKLDYPLPPPRISPHTTTFYSKMRRSVVYDKEVL